MTESAKIACAVATASGFAMPIRISQSAAEAKQDFGDPYRQLVRLWIAGLRLLSGQFFLM